MKSDTDILALRKIHLLVALCASVATSSVTAATAYYGLKSQIDAKDRDTSDRVSRIELSDSKTFIDKDSFNKLTDKVDQIGQDVAEIKASVLPRESHSRHR